MQACSLTTDTISYTTNPGGNDPALQINSGQLNGQFSNNHVHSMYVMQK